MSPIYLDIYAYSQKIIFLKYSLLYQKYYLNLQVLLFFFSISLPLPTEKGRASEWHCGAALLAMLNHNTV